METHKIETTEDRSILYEVSRRKMVVGAKQLRKALQNGRAKRVYLAGNADPAITEPIEAICRYNDIKCTWVATMAELGQACGIDVGAAAAAAVE